MPPKNQTQRNTRRAYLEVFLVIFILSLFICSHFLSVISNSQEPWEKTYWMGLNMGNLMTDIVLYSAIFLTFILFLLVLQRNFIVRKRRGAKR